MYRIAICDDEQQRREDVRRMLLELSVKSGIDFATEEFSSGEALLAHYSDGGEPFHIWVLDIEMDGLTGIETARKLREMKRLSEQIIFLTSYAEYMLESFDVMTFQYLLKPVDPEVFAEKMLKLCRYFEEKEQEILIVKSADGELVLHHDDIIAIEAANSLTVKHKLKITTTRDVHDGRGLISSYADTLKGGRFLQIHRSVLVNLSHVHKFAGNRVVMSNGMELPIGRSKLKEVKDACTRFMVLRME
ncbi:LytR/AlgR family response regulator transcription factor [Paenibacillus hunanensis]|uniref:DNA-binding LytR/AlgR family response regulator n=1 Tax=Paenibacillus hunanensis TaxID=539262 RepID=A0ABU1IVD6_9BACL|nr:LytTR family DNA-binding domain-containing protein [Paenibacillus hunanensis]MDR6242881.1 DNA-binding LytR/AlgR family response regulator [Paenibacillus hunanensis]GGJ03518.1 DNA-binding response regulator [Paenibacillus hunanensis]